MPKVLISDKMDPKAAQIFRERGVEVDEITGKTPAELMAIIGDYDGLAIRSSTKVTKEILEAATNLKVVGRAGIGVDNVDIPAASAKGVVVMNTPFGNSITTAEHAIALMFALARDLPEADRSTQAGKWEKNRFMGVEMTAKTLGLIGAGNIGSIVADRARGLRMKVIAYDPFLTPERAVEMGVEKVDLDALLARADFITLHTPLTDQTRNILSAENLAKTKPGVRIVNCARGGLIDEAALKAGLDSGHIAGAALDVFVTEPAKVSPLFGTPNFVSTPHLGASTTEAQVNVAIQVAEQMADFLVSGGVTNALNMPSLSAEEAPKLKPYMALAERLGSLVGQLATGAITRISVQTEGAAALLNPKPITSAVLAGFLQTQTATVNMVNAPLLARERGVEVQEVRTEREGDYHTLLRVAVKTADGERSVVGTLFGRPGAAAGGAVRHQGRGRSGGVDAVRRQRGCAGLHRPARHRAGRGGGQHRHLPSGAPLGRGRGGAAAQRRRTGDQGTARHRQSIAGGEDGDGPQLLTGLGVVAMTALLPEGFRDALPPHADAAAALEARVLEAARRHGYERVDPPLAEAAAGLESRLKAGGLTDAVRFVDPISQETLAIRPDLTAQVARIAATRMAHHPRPVRLSYAGSVLKLRGHQLAPMRERRQIGAELIGLDSVSAAQEMVTVAVEALDAAGASGVSIDFTLPDLVETLAAGPLPVGDVARLRDRLDAKDAGGVAALAPAYLPLIEAAGPFERALERLRAFDATGVLASRLDGLAGDRRATRRPCAADARPKPSVTGSSIKAGSVSRCSSPAPRGKWAAGAPTPSSTRMA